MDWLEVSLAVNGELAEAVAEVLARYSNNSVTLEQGIRHLDDEDAGTPDGPITVRAYLPADEQLDERRNKIEQALHFLGLIQTLPTPGYRAIADQNWMEAWKKHYHPIEVGRRLLVLPAWMESEAGDRIAVKIDPGMAFGTGTHPSTQLCLGFLDSILDPSGAWKHGGTRASPSTLIDVGCGSGILSIAAIKLGVTSALGVDIDPASIQNARENAKVNAIGSELSLEVGSIAEILAGSFNVRSAALVVVNILAPVIVRLLEEHLAALLEPDGCMFLAGILEGQAAAVEGAVRNAGLSILERRGMGEWIALAVAR